MKAFVEDSDLKIAVSGNLCSFHWNKGYFSNSNVSLYFWSILTKLLIYEPVILRIQR